MTEYKLSYESQLDTFQLYYRYGDDHRDKDWRAAALRGPALPALGNAVAGAVGAAVSNVATYPLSLIVARLQTERQNSAEDEVEEDEGSSGKQKQKTAECTSVLDAARKILNDEGVGGLYAGVSQDTAKTVADSFLFFLAYTFFRQRRIRARFGATKKNVILPVLDELVVGMLAGSFGKLLTTPLANIVTRRQTSTLKRNRKGSSTKEIAAQIRAEKGLAGFWAGYPAAVILTLNPSITFFLNEALKYVALPREKRGNPSGFATFILAAISKAVASSVTYPFSLAKTRAQDNGSSSDSNTRGSDVQNTDTDGTASFTPEVVSTLITIARTEGVLALYSGLSGEVLKGFFSHGITMLAKDAVYASVVRSYYLLLIALRRYPSPEELVERARKQAEECAEAASDGAKDVAEKAKAGAEEALESHSGSVAVDMTSSVENSAKHGVDSSSGYKVPWDPAFSDSNETAELVGDYVEDEANEWKSLYHWFWEKDRK